MVLNNVLETHDYTYTCTKASFPEIDGLGKDFNMIFSFTIH